MATNWERGLRKGWWKLIILWIPIASVVNEVRYAHAPEYTRRFASRDGPVVKSFKDYDKMNEFFEVLVIGVVVILLLPLFAKLTTSLKNGFVDRD